MRRTVLHFLLVTAALLLAPGPISYGKVIYVDDDAPVPGDGASWVTAYRFLQDALTDARTAEKPVEIRVAQGLYKPDRSAASPQGTGDRGATFNLIHQLTLRGGYAGLDAVDPNAWNFQAYETVLSGDLAGNDAEVIDAALLRDDPTRDDNTGWAVYSRNAQVRLEGCSVTGGTGGGLVMSRGGGDVPYGLVVSDCTFSGNRGSEGDAPSAGALSASWYEPGVVLERCSFVGNAGNSGAVQGGNLILRDCQFTGNYGWGGSGGGAALLFRPTIIDCAFTDNRAKRHGGAVRMEGAPPCISRLLRCVFRRNSAGEWGGGLVCDGDTDVRDCVFVGNEAATRGGACVHSGGKAVFANCAFIGNRANDRGGACFAGWKISLEVMNCTIAKNQSLEGAFLALDYNSEEMPSRAIVSNCVLWNGDDEIWSNDVPVEVSYTCLGQDMEISAESDDWLVVGPGNIEGDPWFADPGYWDANGTPDDPNDDFFVERDYHLKSQAGRWDQASGNWVRDDVTSPCIDAGDPNSPIGYEPFPNGGVINMGAYGGTTEASKSYFGGPPCETIIAGDINGDCKVDLNDLAILLRHWLETGERAEE